MRRTRPRLAAALLALVAVGAACDDDDNKESVATDAATTSAAPDTSTPAVEVTDPPSTSEPDGAPDTNDPEEATVPDTSGTPSSTPDGCAEEPTEEAAGDLLVGLTEEEATTAAEECGWILRVARRDGEDLAMTMDLRPNRVNVEVTDGSVTAVVSIG